MMYDVRQLDQRDLPELREKVERVLRERGDVHYNSGRWILSVSTRHWKFVASTFGIDFEGVVYDGATVFIEYFPNLSDHPRLRLDAHVASNGPPTSYRHIDLDFVKMIYEVIKIRGAVGTLIGHFENNVPTTKVPQGFWRRLSDAFKGVFT